MPTYKFLNTVTNKEHTDFMSISALEGYLRDNPHVVQLVHGSPAIVSGRGRGKPDDSFRDVLKEIKKKNSKGLSKSTINTF
jgi:hypothetical protein